jgi:hypothetical protein
MSFTFPFVRALFQTSLKWGTNDYVILKYSFEDERFTHFDDEWEITYYSREPMFLNEEATAEHVRALLEEVFELHIGHWVGSFRAVPVHIVGCDRGHIAWYNTIGPRRGSEPPDLCENTDDRWFCFPVIKNGEYDSIALEYSACDPNLQRGTIWTRCWPEETYRHILADTSRAPCACERCLDRTYPHH